MEPQRTTPGVEVSRPPDADASVSFEGVGGSSMLDGSRGVRPPPQATADDSHDQIRNSTQREGSMAVRLAGLDAKHLPTSRIVYLVPVPARPKPVAKASISDRISLRCATGPGQSDRGAAGTTSGARVEAIALNGAMTIE